MDDSTSGDIGWHGKIRTWFTRICVEGPPGDQVKCHSALDSGRHKKGLVSITGNIASGDSLLDVHNGNQSLHQNGRGFPGDRSREDRRKIIHPEASEDNEIDEKGIFSVRYVTGPQKRHYSTIDDFGEASYGNFTLLHEHKGIPPKKLAGPNRSRRAGGAGCDAKRGCDIGLQGSGRFDASNGLPAIEVTETGPTIVEVVDSIPARRINEVEGHESDNDRQGEVKDERSGLLQVADGKYPEIPCSY